MGHHPPDEPRNDHLPPAGSGQNGNGSNGKAGNIGSNSRGRGGAHKPPDGPDLGLPEDYDHELHSKYIPTHAELQKAARDALDREYAFMILNKGEPEKIAGRLEKIAGIALAASQVDGSHQAKAIRLGLELELQYWLARNKVDEWVKLISPMIITALRIGDHELQSRIYQAWSIYAFTSRDQARAEQTLTVALECADDAGREDVRLLVRVERYNVDVLGMSLEQAHAEGNAILAEARRLNYTFVQAKVYYALAKAYQRVALRGEVFNYAQQALVYLMQDDVIGLAGPCVSAMFNSLHQQNDYAAPYASLLLAYLEKLAQRSVNPYFQAAIYYAQVLKLYHRGDYDLAREFALKAWGKYRVVNYQASIKRVQHMLGMIQAKRHQWRMAERHLDAARKYYELTGDEVYAVHARHALAYLLYEQHDFRRALAALEEVSRIAETISERPARDQLVRQVGDDIEDVKRKLEMDVLQK